MDYSKDYYHILEVESSATKEEIRAAYRRLMKLHHPDLYASDPLKEEKSKEINEAYEVLNDEILRREYDEYLKLKKEWEAKQKTQDSREGISDKNKKTYYKKTTVTTEQRIYVKGKITIKYQARIEEAPAVFTPELFLRIEPVIVNVLITETDIFTGAEIPPDFRKSYTESELFKSPIPQPVKCTIQRNGENEYYELTLTDIRIKNIQIEGVTRHENLNFGTLTGDLFAYHPKLDTHEEVEEVVSCFGPTGEIETKEENSKKYYRKQFYNPDCTTSWTPWIEIREPAFSKSGSSVGSAAVLAEGCGEWWWLPVVLIIGILSPQFLILSLILFGIWALFNFGGVLFHYFGRLLNGLALLMILAFIFIGIKSFNRTKIPPVKRTRSTYDSISTTRTTPIKPGSDSANTSADTLITHFIRWQDYSDNLYSTTVSVSMADLHQAKADHSNMNYSFVTNSLGPAYIQMLSNENSLQYVFNAFDSIRAENSLDDVSFARAIVSCIQSVPYFLVLEGSCNDSYNDEFIRSYLSNCTQDCCIGNEKFGVRSPVEFLSDLKGDCDTRALLLYAILSHYQYNVALITSQYYKHAMIAVHLPTRQPFGGVAMTIRNKNYFLWETTSSGFDAGDIPVHLRELNYWDITLLNETN